LRQPLVILGCMYLGYGGMMVCRQTVVILSPALVVDPELQLTKVDLGNILGWGTAGALLGKFLCGPLADVIGGRRMFLLSLVVAAALVVVFGMAPYSGLFAILTFAVWCAKSGGWPAMAKLIGNWFQPSSYGRVWGVLSTSSRASVLVGTLTLGALLNRFSWETVAMVSGGTSLLLLLLCFRYLRDKPADPESLDQDEVEQTNAHVTAPGQDNTHPLAGKTLAQALLIFAKSHRVWLICLSLMALTVLMEFLSFVPVYLQENLDLSSSRAATASAVFPAGSLLAVLIGGFLHDKVSRSRRRLVFGAMLAVAVLCIEMLMWMPDLEMSANHNYWATLGIIFLFGLSISPAYYLPMSVFSVEYGGPHSGMLISLIDAAGFGAAMVFSFAGGEIAEAQNGWSTFMMLLSITAVAAAVLTVAFLHAEYRAECTAAS